jgi:hypothetical protein
MSTLLAASVLAVLLGQNRFVPHVGSHMYRDPQGSILLKVWLLLVVKALHRKEYHKHHQANGPKQSVCELVRWLVK